MMIGTILTSLEVEKMLEMIKPRKDVFAVVRLVNVNTGDAYTFNEDGSLNKSSCKCFDVWGKGSRCSNCISLQAYGIRGQLQKFEFKGDDIYYVIARYMEYEGQAYVLELVSRVDSKIFAGAIDSHEFAEKIRSYEKKLYTDALTGAYNRLYLEEQLQHMDHVSAAAMLDMDHFKSINDRFGHQGGDAALQAVARTILANIRSTDALIRYGGDEFLLVFAAMKPEALRPKLDYIRRQVEEIRPEDYPEMRMTISVGAIYTDKCDTAAIKQIDDLMYRAKGQRNLVVVA